MDSEKESDIKNFLDLYSSSVTTFNIRFLHHITKISGDLNYISMLLLEADEEYQDELVLKREKKLATEFSKLFSRNNLYSIQLKLNKFEKEIIIFYSNECCKISEAFILRTLVLSLFRCLSNSTMVYLKFLKKCNIKRIIKLKELLNYISQAYEMCKYVVDHKAFEIHDIISMCTGIAELIQIRKYNNTPPPKIIKNNVKFKKITATCCTTKPWQKSKRTDVSCYKNSVENVQPVFIQLQNLIPEEQSLVQCKSSVQPVKRSENFSFVHVVSASSDCSNFDCGDIICKIGRTSCCKVKIYEKSLLLCNTLLNQLIDEVCDEINQYIRQIAIDTYNEEFSNQI